MRNDSFGAPFLRRKRRHREAIIGIRNDIYTQSIPPNSQLQCAQKNKKMAKPPPTIYLQVFGSDEKIMNATLN
ncbi:hypothetical protein [Photobacterium kasasachensis]|uniref:hypothetical protein n=1 Tax=Photobacterium kasasachensis TaxID=2910240 RepID=UPI003D0D5B76